MADYRAISQEYAKEGIKAVLLLNSGAVLVLLTQAAKLIEHKVNHIVIAPILWWTVGTVIAVLLWSFAFASIRYVDKSILEENQRHLHISNILMNAGLIGFLLSIGCFLAGAVTLALSIDQACS